jgi:hypothetical protein
VVDAWEKECVVQEGGSDAKVVENIRWFLQMVVL